MFVILSCFFFQAEDGIRDGHVTGVQTCALPISRQSHGLTRRWPRVALRWTCGYARSTARPPDSQRFPGMARALAQPRWRIFVGRSAAPHHSGVSTRMTLFGLVRHGQTDYNRQHLFQGSSDIPLNDTGREQAHQALATATPVAWDAVITSPLARAQETGRIIASDHSLSFEGTDPDRKSTR